MEYLIEKQRTESYLKAIRVLRELLQTQGEDVVSRAFAEVTSEVCLEAFAQSRGLRPSDGRLCVQRLLGRQCVLKDCVPPGSDHDTLWLSKDGKPTTYLLQPYELGWEEMKKLVGFCTRHGLRADIETWPSFHFPGRVLSIHLGKEKGN